MAITVAFPASDHKEKQAVRVETSNGFLGKPYPLPSPKMNIDTIFERRYIFQTIILCIYVCFPGLCHTHPRVADGTTLLHMALETSPTAMVAQMALEREKQRFERLGKLMGQMVGKRILPFGRV